MRVALMPSATELGVFFDNSLKGLRLFFLHGNTVAVCRSSEACYDNARYLTTQVMTSFEPAVFRG